MILTEEPVSCTFWCTHWFILFNTKFTSKVEETIDLYDVSREKGLWFTSKVEETIDLFRG